MTRRTYTRMANRGSDLARIHCLQKELKLSPEDAEAVKRAVTGVASSADMSVEQRAKVIAHLEGLVPRGDGRQAAKKPAKRLSAPLRKMYALWQVLAGKKAVEHRSYAALEAYAKRQTGVDKLEWLNEPQQSLVIESLKAWVARVS